MWHIDVRRIPLYPPEVSDESIVEADLTCRGRVDSPVVFRPGETTGPLEATDDRGDEWEVPKALVVEVSGSEARGWRVRAKAYPGFTRRATRAAGSAT